MKRFSESLKVKILIGYGFAFALMILVIIGSVSNIVSLGRATEAILRENYRSILSAENMIDALTDQNKAILLLLLGDKEGEALFLKSEAWFFEWLARAKDNITIKGEKEIVESIETSYSRFQETFYQFIKTGYSQVTGSDPSIELYQHTFHPFFIETKNNCLSLLQLNENAMYDASVSASRMAEVAIWSTLIVSFAALLIGFIFSVFLAGKITRPLGRFIEAARKLSAGEYTIQVPVETKDELGILASEFNQLGSELARYHAMKIDQIVLERNKISAILSSIADPILVFDVNLIITSINPAARRVLNLEFAEYGSLHCTDVFPSSNVCKTIQLMMEEGAQPDLSDEERILSLNEGNGERYYLFSITTIRDKDRTITGSVLILKDITNLKEVERLKSEFITAAAHELKTPLTSIGMSIGLLKETAGEYFPEREKELLQTAYDEIHRMKALITDLLDYSKIESGKINLEMEEISPTILFDFVQSVFKEQVKLKNAEILTNLPEELPLIRVDVNKASWVLTNLVSNALRYIDTGGQIHISAVPAGSYLQVSVHDTGPGIPKEYQTKIFQKFFQIKSQDERGAGLGLAICKEILRAHGGNIWVESQPGKGSTFIFTLPLVRKP
jgi:NtrC-family two-component system sensor histidine kinase KinB